MNTGSGDTGSTEPATAGRRVVLHPRTVAARRQDRARSFGSHVRGYTVDSDDAFALMRSQRRGALRFFMLIFGPLVLLPLLFALIPDLSGSRLGPLPPLAWLILGPVMLSSIVVVAAVNDRVASRREDRWAQQHDEPDR